jgi:hypothetical protein
MFSKFGLRIHSTTFRNDAMNGSEISVSATGLAYICLSSEVYLKVQLKG